MDSNNPVSAAEATYRDVLTRLVALGYADAHIQADLAGAFIVVPRDAGVRGAAPYALVGAFTAEHGTYDAIPTDRALVLGWSVTLYTWDGESVGIRGELSSGTTAALTHLLASAFAGVDETRP